MASLQERLDDQEDRGRLKNLRIISLLESSEGKAWKVKLKRVQWVSGLARKGV